MFISEDHMERRELTKANLDGCGNRGVPDRDG